MVAVISAMRSYPLVLSVQARGCAHISEKAVGDNCADDDPASTPALAAAFGAVEVIAAAMRAHPASVDVHEGALAALMVILRHRPAANSDAAAGVPRAALAALAAHPKAALLLTVACGALWTFYVCAEAASPVPYSEAVRGVLSALQSKQLDAAGQRQVAHYALGAIHAILAHLLADTGAALTSGAAAAAGDGSSRSAAVKRRSSRSEKTAAMPSSACPIQHCLGRELAVRTTEEVVRVIGQLAASATAMADTQTLKYACAALAILTSSSSGLRNSLGAAAVAAGGVDAVCSMLRAHGDDAAVAEAAVSALHNLVLPWGGGVDSVAIGDAAVVRAVEVGAVKLLLQAMEKHAGGSAGLQGSGSAVLDCLGFDSSGKRKKRKKKAAGKKK